MTSQLLIKNMVCNRCILAVKTLLEEEGLKINEIELGRVVVDSSLSDKQLLVLDDKLEKLGFERIENRKSIIIEKVKQLIIEIVHYKNDVLSENLSDYLSSHLHIEYHYLSTLFSETAGVTIEKYFIAQKIERVKELLVYDEMTLNEIADMMHYSSSAHLSNQFKKVTGLTPSHFKKIGENKRKPLDEV